MGKVITKSSFDFYRKQARRIDNEGSRNPCPALCRREARRSRRRIGPSFCKQARPMRVKLRGKHSPLLVKHTGHLFIHSFDVVATRRPTRKISSKVSLFIYLNTTR